MGIRDFNSFVNLVESQNETCKISHRDRMRVNTIIIDGSFMIRRSFYVACKTQEELFGNLFNINHVYQDVCIRTAMIVFNSLEFLFHMGSVKDIIITHDQSMQKDLNQIASQSKEIVPQYFREYYKTYNIKEMTQLKRISNTKVTIDQEQFGYFDIRAKAIEQMAIMIAHEAMIEEMASVGLAAAEDQEVVEKSAAAEDQEVVEESVTTKEPATAKGPTTNEPATPDLFIDPTFFPDVDSSQQKIDFVDIITSKPFITNHISVSVANVILILLREMIERKFPSKHLRIVQSHTEADFEVYAYVYQHYINKSLTNILIVSKDTDYFICGYNERVFLYDLTSFYHPFIMWDNILLKHYHDQSYAVGLILRVSFAFGNDYFKNGILGADNKALSRLDKLQMLMNIDNRFYSIASIKGGVKLKNHYNINTSVLSNFSQPFTPEMIDLVILTGLKEDDKITYITSLYQLKYVIEHMENPLGSDYRQPNPLDWAGRLIESEITLGVPHYDGNPLLMKRVNTSKTLYDLVSNNIEEYRASFVPSNNTMFALDTLMASIRESYLGSTNNSSTNNGSPMLTKEELTRGFSDLVKLLCDHLQ